jgi:hypothetical protein
MFIPQNLANNFASTRLSYLLAMGSGFLFKYEAGISSKACYSLCIHGGEFSWKTGVSKAYSRSRESTGTSKHIKAGLKAAGIYPGIETSL